MQVAIVTVVPEIVHVAAFDPHDVQFYTITPVAAGTN